MSNKTRIYLYVALLFVLTYLLANRIFTGIRTHEFDYLKLTANGVILAYVIYQIIKFGKIENDKTDL
ncbi:hypothetical protein OX283_013000 [Flavobacterium sp. SUN052]|uniref:hypothetical protein n=1 Tax=Flavobacterium sp. SUN052 TaxID=3002441 RepID=UPI00237E4B0F|nr:hypothetical protein [Flavobacterium sp. SUN052]MEC4005581.1 hypothetical protein [Flavobacterium sp. SUN052]